MMNASDLEVYLDLLFQELSSRSLSQALLLCDSWSANRDDALLARIQEKHPGIKVEKMIIPGGKIFVFY